MKKKLFIIIVGIFTWLLIPSQVNAAACGEWTGDVNACPGSCSAVSVPNQAGTYCCGSIVNAGGAGTTNYQCNPTSTGGSGACTNPDTGGSGCQNDIECVTANGAGWACVQSGGGPGCVCARTGSGIGTPPAPPGAVGGGTFGQVINPFGESRSALGEGGALVTFFRTLLVLIFVAAGMYAFIRIVLAGLKFISAGGDSKKIGEAWEMIWSSLLGLVIIISSLAIAALIGQIVYGDPLAILSPRIFGPN